MQMRRSLFIIAFLPTAIAQAAEPRPIAFQQHVVDQENTLSAAAAIDVNKDGKLDIVTGAHWYEAPEWKKHPVRDVEFIRGRYDDYACLPLDVNGDGHVDFCISNYRSEKLGWVENPGDPTKLWTEHVIEKPGPMETGRLADVDDDGRLDLLPNGRDFAAWWEIKQPKSPGAAPEFVRHDLPPEIVGHGIGVGDVNGDGRSDLVGPNGWLEAPEDRKRDRWLWHPEFALDRDASVPIVVTDIDADGDADLVWGRGHRTGLWWMEQTKTDGKRTWQPHAIDTSWSQPHTVELGDLDGDGRPEIVAGKRYLGHDGNDPGEWDPLAIYWYRYLRKTRTFERGVISYPGKPAGFDLDPKLVDLDGDGDLDVLAPGRSGLYWFENSHANEVFIPYEVAPGYSDHSNLLVVREWVQGDRIENKPLKTAAEWAHRRAHIMEAVEQAMGQLPEPSRRVPLDVEIVSSEDAGKYERRKITFAAEPGDRVPAWLLVPKDLKKPAPAMLCLHQTVKIGKDEPAGLGGSKNLHYAHELAERGYVCIVPDYPSFGEYPFDFKAAASPEQGGYVSGSMKAIWNNIRAIDVLETQPNVDREKIGVIGHSLGGHNAIFTAIHDLRIRAVVTSCGFTAFPDYYGGNLKGWTSDRYMPRIRDQYNNDPKQVPFDFTELIAAIAPRPFFTNSPLHDANFDVGGVRKVIASAGEVYELLGAKDAIRAEYPDSAHDFPPEVRKAAYDWLEEGFRSKKKK